MNKILEKKKIAENTYLMQVEAPEIAKNAHPGQFVILRLNETGERIPLTISDFSKKTITIVFQAVGRSTQDLAKLKKGSKILDLLGPLGHPSVTHHFGNVILVGGGLGIAPLYPLARELKKTGNKIITIVGARSKENLFWEDKLKEVSDIMVICTNDGSVGRKGFVTNALMDLLRRRIDRVFTIGPLIMMREVCKLTRQRVKTIVSINSTMIDGIGMCGGCRLTYDGEVKFACVDGPDFEGDKVDFEELLNRSSFYEKEEKHVCKLNEKVKKMAKSKNDKKTDVKAKAKTKAKSNTKNSTKNKKGGKK